MSSRGFIKPVDGAIRLRWARPGYDADDLTLDANKIAFDSGYPNGAVNFLQQFTYIPPTATTTWPTTETKIVDWADRGYIPLTYILARDYALSAGFEVWRSYWLMAASSVVIPPIPTVSMRVRADGLYIRAAGLSAGQYRPLIRVTTFAVET